MNLQPYLDQFCEISKLGLLNPLTQYKLFFSYQKYKDILLDFILSGSIPCHGQKESALFLQIHSGKSKKHYTLLDWTSQIPLTVAFSTENNQTL